MARDHARMKTSMWRKEDWRALTVESQWLYQALAQHEALSRCGVVDYRAGRIAALASNGNASKIDRAAKALEAGRYIVIDRQTEELLVRTYVRHDGVLDRKNMGKAVGRALAVVVSTTLRRTVLDELARLYAERPDLTGWEGIEELFPDDMAQIKAMSSTIPLPIASGE